MIIPAEERTFDVKGECDGCHEWHWLALEDDDDIDAGDWRYCQKCLQKHDARRAARKAEKAGPRS